MHVFKKMVNTQQLIFHREKINTIQRKQDLIPIDCIKHLAFLYHLQLAV